MLALLVVLASFVLLSWLAVLAFLMLLASLAVLASLVAFASLVLLAFLLLLASKTISDASGAHPASETIIVLLRKPLSENTVVGSPALRVKPSGF